MPIETNKQTSAFGGIKGNLLSTIQDVENEIRRLGEVREALRHALITTEDAESAFTSQAQYMTGNLMRVQPTPPPFPVPPAPPMPAQPTTQFMPTRDGDDKRVEDSALKALDAAFSQPAPVAKAKS